MPISLFGANDGVHGAELWRTDGTTAGTTLLLDLWANGSSNPSNFVQMGSQIFFTADTAGGRGLYRSDGTVAGTVLLAPAYSAANADDLIVSQGMLYFTAGPNGNELWKTDGSGAGTSRVASTIGNPISLVGALDGGVIFNTSNNTIVESWYSGGTAATTTRIGGQIGQGVTLDGYHYYAGPEAGGGTELYRSDGTTAGTGLFANIAASGASNPTDLTLFGGELYFIASGSASNPRALWKTDGTVAGTQRVGLEQVDDIAVDGNRLIIAGSGYIATSDGTTAGTQQVANFPGRASMLTAGDGLAYFLAQAGIGQPAGNVELWRTDGTAGGTYLLRDIGPGTGPGGVANLHIAEGRLYFTANDGAIGNELWTSDGTSAGTVPLADINQAVDQTTSIFINWPNVIEMNHDASTREVIYVAHRVSDISGIWTTDGTVTTEVARYAVAAPTYLTQVGDRYFYFADNNLYSTDGTSVTLVKAGGQVAPVSAGSLGPDITEVFNGDFYYLGSAGGSGTRLIRSDGTAAGTVELSGTVFSPQELVSTTTHLYYRTSSALWVSDGTAAGTTSIAFPGTPRDLVAIGDTLYFGAAASAGGDIELWRADGTSVQRVADIYAGAQGSFPDQMANLNGVLMFTAYDGIHGRELWRSDGTAAGTYMIKDITPGLNGVQNGAYPPGIVMGGKYVLPANGSLWFSDGTTEGTTAVPLSGGDLREMVSIGDKLIFRYNDGVHGLELWVSDGTVAGTHIIADLVPGAGHFNSDGLVGRDGFAYFTFNDPQNGYELWRTDGTAAGTLRVSATGSEPRFSSSNPGTAATLLDPGAVVNGTAGNDTLIGGAHDNQLFGLGGDDYLAGLGGADLLNGGSGYDYADYRAGTERVVVDLTAGTGQYGDAQGDTYVDIEGVIGTAFNDSLTGNGLANHLIGGNGDDALYGQGGDDLLWGGLGADAIFGGDGVDTATYAGNFGAIHIDLAAGTGQWNYAEGDTLSGIEAVIGTDYDDWIVGDAGANRLDAGAGNDRVDGGAGADVLIGGTGIDTLDYSATFGGVWVDLETGQGHWNAADGDTISGFEQVVGTTFADWIYGNADNNVLTGGDGDDRLVGRAGNDTLRGGLGADTLDGGADVDTADYSGNFGGIWIDLATGTGHWNYAEGDTLSSIERVIGTDYADRFDSNGATNIFTGGGGDDLFVFNPGFGQDVITDFAGNGAAAGDTIRFGAGTFASYQDMIAKAAQQGNDVVITLDAGNALTLLNIQLGTLHSSDFLFG